MLTIHIEDELEKKLSLLAKKEHTAPDQFVKKLINDCIAREDQEPQFLKDIINDLPELPSFNKDPVTIQRSLRNDWG